MNVPIETTLLEKFKTGDKLAFEMVFKDNYKQLRVSAFLLLGDECEAEDAVQQTFLDIWNKRLYEKIDISIKPYLHKAIHNRCLNILGRNKTRQKFVDEYTYAEGQPIHSNDMPEQEGLSPLVKDTLDALPPQRKAALSLVYLKDKTYKEAASHMGITVNSIKTHLKLGIKQLRSVVGNVDIVHQ